MQIFLQKGTKILILLRKKIFLLFQLKWLDFWKRGRITPRRTTLQSRQK